MGAKRTLTGPNPTTQKTSCAVVKIFLLYCVRLSKISEDFFLQEKNQNTSVSAHLEPQNLVARHN